MVFTKLKCKVSQLTLCACTCVTKLTSVLYREKTVKPHLHRVLLVGCWTSVQCNLYLLSKHTIIIAIKKKALCQYFDMHAAVMALCFFYCGWRVSNLHCTDVKPHVCYKSRDPCKGLLHGTIVYSVGYSTSLSILYSWPLLLHIL